MENQKYLGSTKMVVDLLKRFLKHNRVTVDELPALIMSTRNALTNSLTKGPQIAFVAADATSPFATTGSDTPETSSLSAIEAASPSAERSQENLPAVSIEASLASPKVIISMINGKPYKSLKSHITRAGLTPEIYRALYSLPHDYPMTAPEYSEQRRAAAIRLGYGRKPKR